MKTSKFGLFFLTAILLTACGNKDRYNIDGHLQAVNFEGRMVYLFDNETNQLLDSAILHNGAFAFSGTVSKPLMARIQTNDNQATGFCFLEPGTIYFDFDSDSLSGTPLNNSFYAFNNDPVLLQRRQELVSLYYSQPDSPAKNKRIDSITALASQELSAHLSALIQNNPDNILGAYAFSLLANQIGDAAELEQLLSKQSDIVRQFKPTQVRLQQLQQVNQTAVGKHFVDIEGTDFATGKPIRLSSLTNGKLTLVDFWASWCAPCRNEITKSLVPLYKKYKNKGLQIVGIDVNDKPNLHANAVATLGIKYPQLIDSKDNACDIYGINSIPQIILIAPDGTILARDLRGNAIEEAVNQYLNH